MKICHVITRFIAGGAQENTLATGIGLAERGHDVTLVSGPSRGAEGCLLNLLPQEQDCRSFRFIEEPHLVRPIHPWHDIRAYLNLKRLFETERFDVVHTHSSKAGVIGRLAARSIRKRTNTKVVHTIHGLAFDAFKSAWKNNFYIGLERWCAGYTDGLISVCDAMTARALTAGIGNAGLYTTIYSGFDTALFREAGRQRDAIRSELQISPDTLVLLSIGRLFHFKGAEEFITVLENLYSAGIRNIKGVLVGDGPLRPALKQQARKHLPHECVHFTGLIPPSGIPRWIAAADLVVHASLREGLARVLPQALAAGVPVVSYDIGGAVEIIKDGINGIICPADDVGQLAAAVRLFASEPQRRHALSEGAHATDVTHFSSVLMVDRIEALYRQLREDV